MRNCVNQLVLVKKLIKLHNYTKSTLNNNIYYVQKLRFHSKNKQLQRDVTGKISYHKIYIIINVNNREYKILITKVWGNYLFLLF